MGKSKPQIPPVSEISRELKKNILKNVYFLFGEDSFSIDEALHLIIKSTEKYISTDFDNEVLYGENSSAADIYNAATSFPFGSDKKLIIVKEFEKIRDRKNLQGLFKSPPDFLILILLYNGSIQSFDSEFFRILAEKEYIYEGKELKGKFLLSWIIGYVESKGKIISEDNAQLLIDISGENRSLLEMQIEKIGTFLGDNREITHESIIRLSTAFKEYNIFDLQNAIGKRDIVNSNKIAANMLEKGAEPVYIIFMLVRYFTSLTRIPELDSGGTNVYEASRLIGTHFAYYKDYQAARNRFTEADLYRASASLLKAEESLKTTTTDAKTVILMLINEILSP
jgi:DNA polymerase-3 subunit delta